MSIFAQCDRYSCLGGERHSCILGQTLLGALYLYDEKDVQNEKLTVKGDLQPTKFALFMLTW